MGVVGGNILDGEQLDNIVGALIGDVSGGGKVDGRGLRIAATLFIHKHVICLQRIVVCQGRTNKKRSNNAIPDATNGEDSVPDMPPRWAERAAGEGIPHDVAVQDDCRGQQTCAECSPSLRHL